MANGYTHERRGHAYQGVALFLWEEPSREAMPGVGYTCVPPPRVWARLKVKQCRRNERRTELSLLGEKDMRPHDDPYETIEHVLRVVGKLGLSSVPRRIGQTQAMLYTILREMCR